MDKRSLFIAFFVQFNTFLTRDINYIVKPNYAIL